MPTPGQRAKAKKFCRVPSGKAVVRYVREKSGKHKCPLCQKVMHGLPHGKTNAEVRKLSASQRKPSVLLAGQICNQCRVIALEEAVKVKTEVKELDDVSLRLKPYVQVLMSKIED